jgi:predicted NAD-dependent protein-ADP-ribosyltransferase YbiA (DUF1768 family)
MTIYPCLRIERHGALSSFAAFGIETDGRWRPTVEHDFQAQKRADEDPRERPIRAD